MRVDNGSKKLEAMEGVKDLSQRFQIVDALLMNSINKMRKFGELRDRENCIHGFAKKKGGDMKMMRNSFPLLIITTLRLYLVSSDEVNEVQ